MKKIIALFILCFVLLYSNVTAQRINFLSDSERLAMLEPQKGKIDVVIDSDTYNEIDDQFALVYALRSNEKLNIKAIYAAPFFNEKSSGPADGMEKSFQEVQRVLKLMELEGSALAHRGSAGFLNDSITPLESEAAKHLIEFSKNYSKENPLYVLALGAITNVASAILIDPSLTSRIVVVWLGGNGYNWPSAMEFNCQQDMHATRIIFNSGVPFVQITVMPVVTHLTTTIPEMESYLAGKGKVADYLLTIFKDYHPESQVPGYAKIIWDIGGVAWLVNDKWVPTEIRKSPVFTKDGKYSYSPERHFIRSAYYVDRKMIFEDFFKKVMID